MFTMQFAIKFIDITVVTVVANTAPLFTALLGFFLLGEKLTNVEITSLICSFIGVFILTLYVD
jgi:drug/metabolite transporter (DMT)-like permease